MSDTTESYIMSKQQFHYMKFGNIALAFSRVSRLLQKRT